MMIAMQKGYSRKGQALLVGVMLIGALIIGIFLLYRNNPEFIPLPSPAPKPTLNLPQPNMNKNENFSFSNPKKSAHYETNTPEHGAILAGVPINIVIDFNFDLAVPSSISITKDNTEYTRGETIIDRNKLTLRRQMDQNAPDGLYTVTYNACWPDKTCHDGHFQFAIDRSKSSPFKDMTKEKEITINMKDIMFEPTQIKIAKGTKVIWVNDDIVTHYVNTDSHPAHTYHLEQNSRALEQGDTYSVTFDTPGIYPYHCSAHEANMKGSILVE